MRHLDESGNRATSGHAEIDRMYQDMISPARWVVVRHTHTWRPPTDVYETDDAVVVRVEVAGMKESDFVVSLQGRLLIIGGVRDDLNPKVAYHQMEIRYGEFRVEVYLHWAVDADAITAVYVDGFLHVKLPRLQAQRVRIVETYT